MRPCLALHQQAAFYPPLFAPRPDPAGPVYPPHADESSSRPRRSTCPTLGRPRRLLLPTLSRLGTPVNVTGWRKEVEHTFITIDCIALEFECYIITGFINEEQCGTFTLSQAATGIKTWKAIELSDCSGAVAGSDRHQAECSAAAATHMQTASDS